ncbi:MAG TPA: VIT1/CCC1 transporter family protein [Steroidobacteraceae bacterium]|jgi:VIT1/CCC1 family predicted Fe2+/Mn2+ transporter|nr:VIT1/CCC1 transporter family protein [Steroidobacteraceae bacterium]
MKPVDDIQRFRANLVDELNGAALYNALAAAERDANRRDIFLQLAEAETRHAHFWRDKLTAAGVTDVPFSPTLRTRVLSALARRFGPRFVLPTVAAAEFNDRGKYLSQPDALSISAEERGHAAVVGAIAGPTHRSSTLGDEIGRAEPWHRSASGNNLRAAVLGANDGLVSNFCLVMGVAGAGTPTRTILLTGVAGLVAGACSMALGEWLSVANARELATMQLDKEREEIEQTPEAEQHELALILQAKGVAKAEAQRAAAQIMQDPQSALDTLAREELGIDPSELGGNPWTAAGTSFALFATGAVFPILPFAWSGGTNALVISAGVCALVLAGIGLLTSLFNGRSPGYSALRQVAFGCAAAAVTFGVGRLLDVSLS